VGGVGGKSKEEVVMEEEEFIQMFMWSNPVVYEKLL
jgi:hypothetical protein